MGYICYCSRAIVASCLSGFPWAMPRHSASFRAALMQHGHGERGGHWVQHDGVQSRQTVIRKTMIFPRTIDTTRIPNVAGLTGDRTTLVTTRPCRTPHHTGLGCRAERTPRLGSTPGSTPPVPCYSSATPPRRCNTSCKHTASLGEPCCTTNPWLRKRFRWCRLIGNRAEDERGLQRREGCTEIGQVGFQVSTIGAHPADHHTGEHLTDCLVSDIRTKPPAAGGEEQACNPLES